MPSLRDFPVVSWGPCHPLTIEGHLCRFQHLVITPGWKYLCIDIYTNISFIFWGWCWQIVPRPHPSTACLCNLMVCVWQDNHREEQGQGLWPSKSKMFTFQILSRKGSRVKT